MVDFESFGVFPSKTHLQWK